MLRQLRPSLMLVLTLGVLTGLVFPLVITGLARLLFPWQAQGSLLTRDGAVLGSALIGQSFSAPGYFHPRPSAAGDVGYDGVSSGGSNLGPLSQKLVDQVKERITQYRTENNLPAGTLVPADAVTASGSGLDPHIRLKNAELQSARVGKARDLTPAQLKNLIESCVDGPGLGFLGEPGVNVLRLNLALDSLASAAHAR
jgi:K+-transporting ATPase ATPase C chain